MQKFKRRQQQLTLRKYLHDNMGKLEDGRSRRIIHASSVTQETYCPRAEAIRDLERIHTDDGMMIDTCLRYTFSYGRYVEYEFYHHWAKDIIIGDWQCTHCNHMIYFSKYPIACGECGGKIFDYKEVRFKSEISGIECGVDAIILFPGENLYRTVELKTKARDPFRDMKGPDSEHRIRTNMNLRLIDESNHPHKDKINTQTATVLYFIKGHGAKDPTLLREGIKDSLTPMKDFTIIRDDKQSEIEYNRGKSLFEFRQTGVMPRGINKNMNCEHAGECIVKNSCFSTKYPVGEVHTPDKRAFSEEQ